ncbi:hypothetical protein A0H81_01007 [Grifola frondosa]|uniref:Uncharacterized protein n=1 Tax=Grifola frondosa TaxID=5627 RepID=A0A1C7MQA2_GRIFR|nr:hypothetical protein A0H81_01007 [Grifola frondosa]
MMDQHPEDEWASEPSQEEDPVYSQLSELLDPTWVPSVTRSGHIYEGGGEDNIEDNIFDEDYDDDHGEDHDEDIVDDITYATRTYANRNYDSDNLLMHETYGSLVVLGPPFPEDRLDGHKLALIHGVFCHVTETNPREYSVAIEVVRRLYELKLVDAYRVWFFCLRRNLNGENLSEGELLELARKEWQALQPWDLAYEAGQNIHLDYGSE